MAKAYHHGDLRRALLDETVEEIRRGWSNRLSLRSIASAVGVTPAAAYHHFSDKDELLDCAVGEIGRILYERLSASLNAAKPGKHSLTLGLAYIDFAIDEPALFTDLMTRECTQSQQVQTASLRLVEDALADDGALEDKSESETRSMVFTAWAVVHGFATLVLNKRMTLDEGRNAFTGYWHSQTPLKEK